MTLNRYLEGLGLCRLRPPSAGGTVARLARGAGLALPGGVQSAVFRRFPWLPNRLESTARFAPIDFSRAVAWSEELPYFPSVRLTVPNADAAREAADALAAMRDPVDGGPVFERVALREEVAVGPFADRYPDVIGFPRHPEGYAYAFARTEPEHPGWYRRLDPREYLGVKGRSMNGSHRAHGVAVLAGPGVRAGSSLDAADAGDVTPTLLHLLGLPVRTGMDGRAWTEAFDGEPAARAVRVEVDGEDGPPEGSPPDDRDGQIARRLRSLGYL